MELKNTNFNGSSVNYKQRNDKDLFLESRKSQSPEKSMFPPELSVFWFCGNIPGK